MSHHLTLWGWTHSPFAHKLLLTCPVPLPLPPSVRYRIFALDQDMRPSVDAMTVTVEVSP